MKRSVSPFRRMQRMASLAKQTALSGNHQRLSALLRAVSQWLESGSPSARMAVSSVFLFSVSSWLDLHRDLREEVLALFPQPLKAEYYATLTVCDY